MAVGLAGLGAQLLQHDVNQWLTACGDTGPDAVTPAPLALDHGMRTHSTKKGADRCVAHCALDVSPMAGLCDPQDVTRMD